MLVKSKFSHFKTHIRVGTRVNEEAFVDILVVCVCQVDENVVKCMAIWLRCGWLLSFMSFCPSEASPSYCGGFWWELHLVIISLLSSTYYLTKICTMTLWNMRFTICKSSIWPKLKSYFNAIVISQFSM